MTGFIIIDEVGSLERRAFSLDPSLKLGTVSAWSGDYAKALRFQRQIDAEQFAKSFLPNITVGVKYYDGD